MSPARRVFDQPEGGLCAVGAIENRVRTGCGGRLLRLLFEVAHRASGASPSFAKWTFPPTERLTIEPRGHPAALSSVGSRGGAARPVSDPVGTHFSPPGPPHLCTACSRRATASAPPPPLPPTQLPPRNELQQRYEEGVRFLFFVSLYVICRMGYRLESSLSARLIFEKENVPKPRENILLHG